MGAANMKNDKDKGNCPITIFFTVILFILVSAMSYCLFYFFCRPAWRRRVRTPTLQQTNPEPQRSMDAAAIQFGKHYNDKSICYDVEMAALIILDNANFRYCSSQAGTPDGVTINQLHFNAVPHGTRAVAAVHCHARYQDGYDNDEFSREDKLWAQTYGIPLYLCTTERGLKKYDPTTGITTTILNAGEL